MNAVTLLLFTRSLRISFIIAWNVTGKFVIPKNITVGLNNPIYIVNASFHLSPSFILMLLKPYCKSIFVNILLLPMLSIKSIINDNK